MAGRTEGESAQDASSHVVFATELFLEAEIVHDASSSEVAMVVFSTKSYIRFCARVLRLTGLRKAGLLH